MFAATGSGVWLGRGDDHEIEFVDWSGRTTRRIRWEGPDLAVAEAHVNAYRDDLHDLYSSGSAWEQRLPAPLRSDREWQELFAARWERDREALPSTFPAYGRLLLGDDGVLWVRDYPRPGETAGWRAFDDGGGWIRSLVLPPGAELLDIGADWALVLTKDEQDIERVAVHTLVED